MFYSPSSRREKAKRGGSRVGKRNGRREEEEDKMGRLVHHNNYTSNASTMVTDNYRMGT